MENLEIENAIVEAMNQAEKLLMDSETKKKFVILEIKQKFPNVDESDIESSIEIFIMVSKLSVKMLFNLAKKRDCCIMV